MVECATSRCCRLEKKVVHLSVAMEDKVMSIDLLHRAIHDIDMNFVQESSDIDAKFRNACEEKTRCHDEEIVKLKIECRQTAAKKKDAASEMEQLLLSKEAECKLSACLDEVRVGTEENIMKSKQEWNEGEKMREQEFIAAKVIKVRKATLTALQPELKRLLDNQREEIEQLKQEEDTNLDYSKLQATAKYEVRLSKYRKESETQNKLLAGLRKEEWTKQISLTQEDYTAKFNNFYHERGDWSSQIAAKELGDETALIKVKHNGCIDKILKSRDHKLEEIDNAFKQQELDLDNEFKEATIYLGIIDSNRKEAWRKEEKDRLQMNLKNEFASFRETIKKKRDDTIDKEIRSSQKKETHFEREFSKQAACENDSVDQDYKEKTHCIQEQSTSIKQQFKLKSIAIRDLEKNVQAYQDQFETTERSTERVNDEFIRLKQHNAMQDEDKHTAIEAQTNLNELAVELSVTQDELEALECKIEDFDR